MTASRTTAVSTTARTGPAGGAEATDPVVGVALGASVGTLLVGPFPWPAATAGATVGNPWNRRVFFKSNEVARPHPVHR
jgi:hypothetical protein